MNVLLLPFLFLWMLLRPVMPYLLAFLTITAFLVLFYKTVKLCFMSPFSKWINAKQRRVLCIGGILAAATMLCPPWIVQEPILPDEDSFARPTDAPPRTSYEPIYMGFYSKKPGQNIVWVGPDISAPPLRHKPRDARERHYAKYVNPTRTLRFHTVRFGIQLGLIVLFSGFLFWFFADKKQLIPRPPDDADDGGGWIIIEPEDLKSAPGADSEPTGQARNV